jgi:glycosyltransferase involved in cell wall biosynthesis
MRVLMVHNYYQVWGGEDEAMNQEMQLLRDYGHDVELYSRHNNEIKSFSYLQKALMLLKPSWSFESHNIKQVIKEFKPDIIHFHNFFPLISPSAHYACSEIGIPVVQTLHDFRLLCPNGWFFRDGKVCEKCSKDFLLRGILHGCYRNSRIQVIPVILMMKIHRLLGTWQKKVDAFITLTEFTHRKFIEAGLPETRMFVCPNFLAEDPGMGDSVRDYALFVGRLSKEKGILTLIEAWKELSNVPLKIVGDGPLRPQVEQYIREYGLEQVELVGFVPLERVFGYLKRALFLILPSTTQETFGRVIIEAYATGTPVIASRLGAMIDLVREKKTGLLFNASEPDDLVSKVRYAIEHPIELANWGQKARRTFEQKFSSDVIHSRLMEICNIAIGKSLSKKRDMGGLPHD